MIKILIIEDEPGIYTFLQEGLTDEGYDTLVATDGSDALRDFADWRPDLVLLDWMLPTMDGIEVCRSIRETDVTTPVLFLTAKDGVEDTIKGLRTGANDYIKKPFSFDELLERIKIHFRNRQHDELLRIIKDVWGIDFQYDTGVIDVFMNALRRKLHLKTDGCIKTIRGVGFIATDR